MSHGSYHCLVRNWHLGDKIFLKLDVRGKLENSNSHCLFHILIVMRIYSGKLAQIYFSIYMNLKVKCFVNVISTDMAQLWIEDIKRIVINSIRMRIDFCKELKEESIINTF
jgi:hypothetical protein